MNIYELKQADITKMTIQEIDKFIENVTFCNRDVQLEYIDYFIQEIIPDIVPFQQEPPTLHENIKYFIKHEKINKLAHELVNIANQSLN